MKRKFLTAIVLTLFLFHSRTVSASILDHIEHLHNDSLSEEIFTLSKEAREAIATIYQEKTGQPLPIDTKIDLGDAYKIYVADFLFRDLAEDASLQDYLATVPLVWYYELPVDDIIYILEIASIEDSWQIGASGYSEGPTYAEKLSRIEDALVGDEPVYLVGGLKLIQYPVAMITRNDYPEALVSIDGVHIVDSVKDEVYNDPNHDKYVSGKNPLEYAEGAFGEEAIDFAAMQKLANAVELDGNVGVSIDLALLSETAKNHPASNVAWIWVLGIGTVATLLFFLFGKKRPS